jgi:hypothetical protein
MKICGWCKEAKPADEFRKDKRRRDGRRNECRDCRRTYDRNWKRRNSDTGRAYKLMAKYGMTLEEFYARIEAQDGICPICGGEFDETVTTLVPCVDHDHKTGKVRGILHRSCNSAIGLLGDDPDACLLAAVYLRLAAAR